MEVTKITIDKNNLPKGCWWDKEGASYTAEKDDLEADGWRWMPRNLKAIGKGYQGQELFPFFLPKNIGGLKPNDRSE